MIRNIGKWKILDSVIPITAQVVLSAIIFDLSNFGIILLAFKWKNLLIF